MDSEKLNVYFKNFILLLIFLWLIAVIFKKIVEIIIYISGIFSNTDTVIIVAILTSFFSLISVIISKVVEFRQNKKMYLYEKKEKAYSVFIEIVYKIIESIKKEEEYSDKEMLEDVLYFSKELTLWGSDKVIKQWIEFRNTDFINSDDKNEVVYKLGGIIFEIRKDMGHKMKDVKEKDILSMFINDISDIKSETN